jgi:aminopeptidase-like protein
MEHPAEHVTETETLTGIARGTSSGKLGGELFELVTALYPICRSLTGNGVRETLAVLRKVVPIELHEVPTGTRVYDWTIPQEWNIRDAFVKNACGDRVIDFRQSNLHVMGYSVPVRAKMSLEELRSKLYSLPDHPDWIPFRTSYFNRNWGFSLTHRQLLALDPGEYEVCIDSSLTDGALTYGELLLPGETADEVLISTHICHPSLCNDNLSGIAVATYLARILQGAARRYSYRFVFVPAQIGSLAWLSRNEDKLTRIKHGLVLVALGDPGNFTYKRTRNGAAEIDRVVEHTLRHSGRAHEVLDFWPYGNDERQYSSPGFNLPVGALMRTPCGTFAQYHTSADNFDFIKPEALEQSLDCCLKICAVLEGNRTYRNLKPMGEPQLGPRGLYPTTGQRTGVGKVKEMPILWVLNLSDGSHSLLDIAERSRTPFVDIRRAADALLRCELLEEHPTSGVV